MNTGEIFISIVFALGIVYVLYLFFRDPISILKSGLRALKPDDNLKLLIIFSPVWIPAFIIDKVFRLGIYINHFEEVSRKQTIKPDLYKKYIQVDTSDIATIKHLINNFIETQLYKNPDYNFENIRFNYTIDDEKLILKPGQAINLKDLYNLVEYIAFSSPNNRIFHPQAIFINSYKHSESFFVFVNADYAGRLIGKTAKNHRIYVNSKDDNNIYFNSNIEYFKNFKFNRFNSTISKLSFDKTIKIYNFNL